MTLIDRKLIVTKSGINKIYRYHCNKCGWENGWIRETDLTKGNGCSCCYGRTVVEGINDIPSTAQWMVKYFQGGYNEAKLYTKSSNKSIYPICPECGRIKHQLMKINNIYTNHGINCCNDSMSYPEKFMHSFLTQLKIDYIYQLSNKTYRWIGDYRYDFYIPSLSMIIETNGRQHYSNVNCWNNTLFRQNKIDQNKKNLAIKNNIKEYIIIDATYSKMNWIMNSIKKSKISRLININNIDWNKCHEDALQNIVKLVCNYKKTNPTLSTYDIAKIYKLSPVTIARYLKNGTILGWCKYDPKIEKEIAIRKNKRSKKIEVFRNKKSCGIFNSYTEFANLSKDLFGIKCYTCDIYNVLSGRYNSVKGFSFRNV